MLKQLDFLRELSLLSVAFRLIVAMLFGGIIGLERGRKRRAAGFRTYMLVCIGAALTMLLGQYEAHMIDTSWAKLAQAAGARTDVSRFGAQVINGVGFLGAGTIIVTGRQEIKGLTTAAGLWASACMGLAIGAGFYECVALAFLLIILSVSILSALETDVIEKARVMNLFVEFRSLDDIGEIIGQIKSMDVQIYEMDLDRGESCRGCPSAVFSLRLNQRQPHTNVLMTVSELDSIRLVEEV